MGRHGTLPAFERPLWSTFVWRLEFVNALYEFLLTPLVLDTLRARRYSLVAPLFGVRIGRAPASSRLASSSSTWSSSATGSR